VTIKKVEILQDHARRQRTDKPRTLKIRFLVSPVELIGNDAGQVVAMRLVKNALYAPEKGTLRPKATDQFEEIPVELVFRSVGYRGVPLPGVPFHDKWGIIPNEKGRVIHPETDQPVVGLYVSGWIKRGPSGVIGTNKPDAKETVSCMLEDLAEGALLDPAHPDATATAQLVRNRQPDYVSYEDWVRLDELEVSRGQAQGRPRIKFTSLEEMLVALDR
jgi:ferredoxin--NADP+ reductase